MGEGSQRVSILAAEPTPGGKHLKVGSELFSIHKGQIRPVVPVVPPTHNQVTPVLHVIPALPMWPHQPQDGSGSSSGSSIRVIEMIPQPYKGPPPPKLVMGEKYVSTTDMKEDTPMRNVPPSDSDAEGDTPIKDIIQGYQGNPAVLSPVALPQNAPMRQNLGVQLRKFTTKTKADKGKGRATDVPGQNRPGEKSHKGIAQEGERYADQHPNTERAWEKRTNIQKPGERKSIRESESIHSTALEADRCKDCRNLQHRGKCWPICKECRKRHSMKEC